MHDFLTTMVILVGFVVVLGYFNERVTKLTYEISLMLFSTIIGAMMLGFVVLQEGTTAAEYLSELQAFDLEGFLIQGVLCFMLFASSCHAKLLDFKKNSRPIGLLAIVTTFFGAIFYGLLFYGASSLLNLGLTLPVCLMMGSIIAPTDPIAATSILKKFGMPKDIGFIMEGESLLNDGVGVALFVCFSGVVTAQGGDDSIIAIIFKQLLGALLVGMIVTAIFFPIFKKTEDATRRIFTSLVAVALAYVLCNHFGFSGAVASVVCGVLFSGLRNYYESKGDPIELAMFDDFWNILDTLLNSVLYVILGFSFLRILQMPNLILLSVVAIVINLVARASSVGVSAVLTGKLPDNYDKSSFIKLLTWGGLRGGLSVALAMSTQSMVDETTYYILLGTTYALVFFTTIVQGLTMTGVYNRIKAKVDQRS